MVLRCAPTAVWFAIFFYACTVRATAFWTYTSRYQYEVSTDRYTYRTSVDEYTRTGYLPRTIKPNVIPTVAAISSTTDTYYSTNDLKLIYEWYPPSAVAESDLVPETTYNPSASTTSTTGTVYYMEVTYTAPATCTTSFTYVTSVSVYIPTEVRDQMKPTSTDFSTPNAYTYSTTTWTAMPYVTLYIKPGDAPVTTTTGFYYSYYVAKCINPGASSTTNHNGGNSYSYCDYYDNCNVLKIWVIVIAVILPTLFLLGFIESYIWFRRLMTGQGAMRFGTISWIGISLWVACFTRFQSARSQEDQKLLRQKWKQTSSGTAFKLWWKWGFRHSYPTALLGEYSRNNSGVPGMNTDGTTTTLPQMGYANEIPPPGPPPPPPAFINHNGIIYIPQGPPNPYAPQPTSYLNHSGVIYVPQTEGFTSPTPVSNFTPPPQAYQQGYQNPAYYDASKDMPSTEGQSTVAPTEVSSITHSPSNQYVQPAMSEVSSIPHSPPPGQQHQAPPSEVEARPPGEYPEHVPPKQN